MTSHSPTESTGKTTPLEQEALNALAAQFGLVLLRFFERRVRHRAEAEDLVQEVFMRLLKRGDIAALEDIRAYLFETAASVLTDHARKRRTRHSEDHVPFDPAVHGNEDSSSDRVLIGLIGEEALTRVARALLALPERVRAVFVLRKLEGLRYQDIAQRLNISVSLVEKHMGRALAYLTQQMDDESKEGE